MSSAAEAGREGVNWDREFKSRGIRDGGGRGRGGKQGDGRSGGGGGGGDVQISRALSRLLRHQAKAAGVDLNGEGYARLDRVLNWPPLRSLNVSVADVRRVVENCAKQRFSLKLVPSSDGNNDGDGNTGDQRNGSDDPKCYLIRANQGHSLAIESASMLAPVVLSEPSAAMAVATTINTTSAVSETGTPTTTTTYPIPPQTLHGTFLAFWPAIVSSGGLSRMRRQHIHCTTGTPDDGVVGMRHDAELVIEIDVARSIREGGLAWWRSENGYMLTEGDEQGMLPLHFFKEVRPRGKKVEEMGVGVLVRDGVVVGELPTGLKVTMPVGMKGRGGAGGAGGAGGEAGRGGSGQRGARRKGGRGARDGDRGRGS